LHLIGIYITNLNFVVFFQFYVINFIL